MQALQRGVAWAEERLWVPSGSLSPQNGRVHLHIIEPSEFEKITDRYQYR